MPYQIICEPRRVKPIIFILNNSGHMSGTSITKLNKVMPKVIETISNWYNKSEFQVKVTVITYNTIIQYFPEIGMSDIEKFKWVDLDAFGGSYMGTFMIDLAEKLSRKSLFNNFTRMMIPMIIWITGYGGCSGFDESYFDGLQKLKKNKWFKYSQKISIHYPNELNMEDILSKELGIKIIECYSDDSLYETILQACEFIRNKDNIWQHPIQPLNNKQMFADLELKLISDGEEECVFENDEEW